MTNDEAVVQAAREMVNYWADRDEPVTSHDIDLTKSMAAILRAAVSGATAVSQAKSDVLAERQRQIVDEGWTPEHDDKHTDGSLALAAACYAEGPGGHSRVALVRDGPAQQKVLVPVRWPHSWSAWSWKPTDRRRDLVKAAALILAEIERLDRVTAIRALKETR